jgi:hypothetical protein
VQVKEEVFWCNYFYRCDQIVKSFTQMGGMAAADALRGTEPHPSPSQPAQPEPSGGAQPEPPLDESVSTFQRCIVCCTFAWYLAMRCCTAHAMSHVVGARAALPEPLLDDESLFASDDFLETSLVPDARSPARPH